jgi:hypothetical protein
LGKIIRHIKKNIGRFQREERNEKWTTKRYGESGEKRELFTFTLRHRAHDFPTFSDSIFRVLILRFLIIFKHFVVRPFVRSSVRSFVRSFVRRRCLAISSFRRFNANMSVYLYISIFWST